MSAKTPSRGFTASSSFVVRTPLLPLAELVDWSDGLGATIEALDADCAVLRQRLREFVARPIIADALFVASPSLSESLGHWQRDPDSPRGHKVEHALVRYMSRMASRPTPFGLFSGVSTGSVGQATRLPLPARERYRRHTRLDNDYLFALAEALGRATEVREHLRYYPNSSAYSMAERLHYVEARVRAKARSHHLVAVEHSEPLDLLLEHSRGGATPGQLAAALVADDPEIELDEALAFIDELIDNQVLVSRLGPAVTGDEPIHGMLRQLQQLPAAAGVARQLSRVRDALANLDDQGLGADRSAYHAVATMLEPLPAPVEMAGLLQVDMIKPSADATLGGAVLEEIERALELLVSMTPPTDPMRSFREAFVARYQDREVPLTEALDEELGIGFQASIAPGTVATPLLDGLPFRGTGPAPSMAWTSRDAALLHKLEHAWRAGEHEIELHADDLPYLSYREPMPLPDAFSTMTKVAARSAEALADGDFRVLVTRGSGPSGARLSGRFCQATADLHAGVTDHLEAEQHLAGHAVLAEIVHLPEGKVGNVINRPVLRSHEIAYLGLSGAPTDRQLHLDDLSVRVRDGRVELRSARLGREVRPRLSTAHNSSRGVGTYRFLHALEAQDGGTFGFEWGPFANAPFVPRVRHGRIVLACARWLLTEPELRALDAASPKAKTSAQVRARRACRFGAVQELRSRRGLPRIVVLIDGDNELRVDLDNALAVDSLVQLVKSRSSCALQEEFPAADELVTQGPEGAYCHELCISFVRRAPRSPQPVAVPEPVAARERVAVSEAAAMHEPAARHESAAGHEPAARHESAATTIPATTHEPVILATPAAPTIRRFFPGSAWLFAKLYTGKSSADQVLRQVVRPWVHDALASGAADRWFFMRYGDPDWHLRLRLHGDPGRLQADVLPHLASLCGSKLGSSLVWRVQLDTYEREMERYGGEAGIELAEQLFWRDSEAALTIVEHLDGDDGQRARWRLALRGTDQLLDDLGFDLAGKLAIVERARAALGDEHGVDTAFTRQLGHKYRHHRPELAGLLARDRSSTPPPALRAGFEALDRRSHTLRPVVRQLRMRDRGGLLRPRLPQFAWSLLHMHANRLLRSDQRAQELVLLDMLMRQYRSSLARARRGSPPG